MPLKRSRGSRNLYNPKSPGQITHTRKAVHFPNGKGTGNNDVNLSGLPPSIVSQTSLKKPGAYQVPPTRVANIEPGVNRRSIKVNLGSPNNENSPYPNNRSMDNLVRELEGLGGGSRKTRNRRKTRKLRSKSKKLAT